MSDKKERRLRKCLTCGEIKSWTAKELKEHANSCRKQQQQDSDILQSINPKDWR